jgi:DNA-binding response OmpR family regulator
MIQHNLLVVDDEQRFANILAKRLGLRGFACEVCYSGKEALQIVKRKNFFLILLDLHLPDMYGTEVLTRIKENFSQTPVVILTGHGTEEDRRECMEQGAYAFIHKPSSIEELMGILGQIEEASA